MANHQIEHQVTVSNLNLVERAAPTAFADLQGAAFRDFVADAGYDGVDATVLRRLVMARMFGAYAADLISVLHAPFAGRTFPKVLGDTLRYPRDIGHNVAGLAFTAAMREVEHATPAMVELQDRLGRGPLDAILYPQSGDSEESLVFDDEIAPFKSRSFELTAEVPARWGVLAHARADEQMGATQEAMATHGFDGIILNGLEARRTYWVKGVRRELSSEFMDRVMASGLVKGFAVSVGARPDLQLSRELQQTVEQEAESLRRGTFAETEQGRLLSRALGSAAGGSTFRTTFRERGSVRLRGPTKNAEEHVDIVDAIKSVRPIM